MATSEQRAREEAAKAAAQGAAAAAATQVAGASAAAAVAGAGALSAAAVARAAGQISFGFVAWLASFALLVDEALRRSVSRRTSDRELIERLVMAERDRAREFERRSAERIQAKLPEALAGPEFLRNRLARAVAGWGTDSEQAREVREQLGQAREAAVTGLLRQERRYSRARLEASTVRVHAALDRLELKQLSPQGAYWEIGVAEQHTAGCLFMHGKFWPWEVLDRVHPPRHHGCTSRLYGLGTAIAAGKMTAADIPEPADAIRAAAGVVMEMEQAIELLDEISEGEHWRGQPRDPGGKGGGQWVERGASLTPAVKSALKAVVEIRAKQSELQDRADAAFKKWMAGDSQSAAAASRLQNEASTHTADVATEELRAYRALDASGWHGDLEQALTAYKGQQGPPADYEAREGPRGWYVWDTKLGEKVQLGRGKHTTEGEARRAADNMNASMDEMRRRRAQPEKAQPEPLQWERVAPGEYAADGWTISRINYGHGDEWTAAKPGTDIALDPLPTLKAAQDAVEKARQQDVQEGEETISEADCPYCAPDERCALHLAVEEGYISELRAAVLIRRAFAGAWDEELHPRGHHGRFRDVPGKGDDEPKASGPRPARGRTTTREGKPEPKPRDEPLHHKPKFTEDELPGAVGEGEWTKHVDAAVEDLKAGTATDTEEIYREKGFYTSDRISLHNRIVQALLQGAGHHPEDAEAVFLAGGPASGKSELVKDGKVKFADDAVLINPDIAKEMLPEYAKLKAAKDPQAAAKVHEESSYVAKLAANIALGRKHHVVFDAVGDSEKGKYLGKIKAAQAKGHKVRVTYATVPTDVAAERAKVRGQKTGRNVPEGYLRAAHRGVSERFLDDILPDKSIPFEVYDTASRSKPKLIARRAEGGDIVIVSKEAYELFVAKGRS